MVTNVSSQLWDSLCNVLSSLTHWKEVIDIWKVYICTYSHYTSNSTPIIYVHDTLLANVDTTVFRIVYKLSSTDRVLLVLSSPLPLSPTPSLSPSCSLQFEYNT